MSDENRDKQDQPLLVFDGQGEFTAESMDALIASLGTYGGDRSRPYDGQPWTSHGARGKQPVAGLTMRDVGDCIARGAVLAGLVDETPGIDRDAVIQAALVEIEKMMGIYPNLPGGPVVIPTLTIGTPEPPKDAS
jgi:hypothetical protein